MGRSPQRIAMIGLGVAAALAVVLVLVLGAAGSRKPAPGAGKPAGATAVAPALVPAVARAAPGKIKHVVIIMQENRSFDSYFGTYPGADGIPRGVCVPDPLGGRCVKPFHDPRQANAGGPHGWANSEADIAGGKMDGFVGQAEHGSACGTINPRCSPCTQASARACVDVMGYHDAREIPNYWSYARHYVLQDHLFESQLSASTPAHLYMVSEWAARCADPLQADSCQSHAGQAVAEAVGRHNTTQLYGWTDLTWLLHRAGVSWAYYVFTGGEPDCEQNAAMNCAPVAQNAWTPSGWNPLPNFTDVHQDAQLANVRSLSNFFAATRSGTLPAVSWIIPNQRVSEHPGATPAAGETYVTGLINAVMRSRDWSSTAILLSWDDWGGFYDHVRPRSVDQNGYGLRVPGLLISPYARRGFIDHQLLSHDAYVKLIEDLFLHSQRLDPRTDGRPDPRAGVRESSSQLGNLLADFNFRQRPRKPMILPVGPAPGPASSPP